MYYIRKLLSDESIQKINELKKHLSWQDGNKSYVGLKGIKNCHEAKCDTVREKIQKIIFKHLDDNNSFINFTAALESTSIIISRYEKGMYYRTHHDAPSLGHYSTTLFLNDDYEGGELNLWDNNEVKKVKLPTGWAVTYDTGTRHCVTEVTKGKRDVAIFWTTSRIKNFRDRDMYIRLSKIYDSLLGREIEIPEKIEDCETNPMFMIREILDLIERENI